MGSEIWKEESEAWRTEQRERQTLCVRQRAPQTAPAAAGGAGRERWTLEGTCTAFHAALAGGRDERPAELLCMAGCMPAGGCLSADSYHLGRCCERAKGMKTLAEGADPSQEIYLRKELDLLSPSGLLGPSLGHAPGVW